MIANIDKPKPIIGRVGGKSRLAPWIIEHALKFEWSIWCEPFCGSAATYFRLISDRIPEQVKDRGHHFRSVLNDADKRIYQLFKTCRDNPELLAYAVALTPYSRYEHKLAQTGIDEIEDEIEQVRRYLVDGWQSFAYTPGDSWGTNTGIRSTVGNDKCLAKTWNNLPSRILAASPHLQGDRLPIDSPDCLNEAGLKFVEPPVDARVEMARRFLVDGWMSQMKQDGRCWSIDRTQARKDGIVRQDGYETDLWSKLPSRILSATDAFKKCYLENDDFEKTMRRWDTPHTLHYLDPPYYSCEKYYAEVFKLEDHARLANAAHEVEGQVIISYYPHPEIMKLYSEDDWDIYYKDTVASSAGITRQSKTKTRPKRVEMLLVRKRKNAEKKIVNFGGQLSLFEL